MARLESRAVAGYWPTPAHLVPRIAALFERGVGDLGVVDPCCGEGSAIRGLVDAIVRVGDVPAYAARGTVHYLLCEMERTRHQEAQRVSYAVLHGDAFQVTWDRREGAGLLYLNPPYDHDAVHGRLEERFLARFLPILADDGVCVLVVPGASLEASARTIATDLADLVCYRFPDGDFEAFKQVVLIGRRRIPAFDVRTHDRVVGWARDAAALPVLPERPTTRMTIPTLPYGSGVENWSIATLDLQGLLGRARPWTHRGRTLTEVVPTRLDDVMLRTYPVATPPRPAHIAAGIAAGIFNGSRVEPDDPDGPLPSLLVKGCFDREFRTVEEKVNKEGEVTGFVQVQQPRLRVTVLDLEQHRYVTLPDEGPERPVRVDDMSIAGLLGQYGRSLMTCMERQCPIGFDPRRDQGGALPTSPRRLYRAQANAVHALVKLLGGPDVPVQKRRGRAAILLGELGSGKSTVALETAIACGAGRVLVLCPPHLLTGWTNEIAAVAPDWTARIVDGPESVDALVGQERVVALMSREAAKLSHGWVGLTDRCPRCGTPVPSGDLARTRARCTHRAREPKDPMGRMGFQLLRHLQTRKPNSVYLGDLNGRLDEKRKTREPLPWRLPAIDYTGIVADLLAMNLPTEWLTTILVGLADPALTIAVMRRLALSEYRPWDDPIGQYAMLVPDSQEARQILQGLADQKTQKGYSYVSSNTYLTALAKLQKLQAGEEQDLTYKLKVRWVHGTCWVDDVESGSLEAFEAAVAEWCRACTVRVGPECGETLYQAVPEPRRIALANYVQHAHKDLFDFLVVDESHEYAGSDTAQSFAAGRLQNLRMPTIRMTGTVMSGYCDSLFNTMWATSPEFRKEFGYEDRSKFADRYGYRKQFVEATDANTKVVEVEYGSHSDRQTTKGRAIGYAPGVLPLFLLRHLLAYSVTLHKSDLTLDIPPLTQEIVKVEATKEQRRRFNEARDALVAAMRADQFQPDRSGKLMGQLTELPSYLDRMTPDTGNADGGAWEIRYPETMGSELVCRVEPLDTTDPTPKEAWMLQKLQDELQEGRSVMVLAWHVSLLPRLQRIIEQRTGEKAPILLADKVAPSKRQSWIDKEIVRKGRRILVCNPVAIQTGLNNLVGFSTQIWMENPAVNANTYRQAVGRIDRIGQTRPTRVYSVVYRDGLQQNLQDLLANKVAVATATDGLDPESALRAAGVGDDTYMAALSIGKHLWRLLNEDA